MNEIMTMIKTQGQDMMKAILAKSSGDMESYKFYFEKTLSNARHICSKKRYKAWKLFELEMYNANRIDFIDYPLDQKTLDSMGVSYTIALNKAGKKKKQFT